MRVRGCVSYTVCSVYEDCITQGNVTLVMHIVGTRLWDCYVIN